MGKEDTRYVKNPREEAFGLVTKEGTHNLKVDRWLDAGRPGNSKKIEPVQATVVRACGFCSHIFHIEHLQS